MQNLTEKINGNGYGEMISNLQTVREKAGTKYFADTMLTLKAIAEANKKETKENVENVKTQMESFFIYSGCVKKQKKILEGNTERNT